MEKYDIYYTSVHVEHTTVEADSEEKAMDMAHELLMNCLYDTVFDYSEDVDIEVRPAYDIRKI